MEIKVGETLVINDADGGDFSVTACDANHCPGINSFVVCVVNYSLALI